jgi:uncharacterized membrane protein YhaH (DUF805 family)
MLVPTLLDPRGRCNRKGLLIIATAMFGIQAGLAAAFWGLGWNLTGPGATMLKLLFCWLALSACSKRLHDLNLSAWNMAWALPVTVLWTLGTALAFVFSFGLESLTPKSPWYLVAMGSSMLPMLAATLWLHFAKGTPGANRFGPEPDGLGFSSTAPALSAQPA